MRNLEDRIINVLDKGIDGLKKVVRVETEPTKQAVHRYYEEKEELDKKTHAAFAVLATDHTPQNVNAWNELTFAYGQKNREPLKGFHRKRAVILFNRKSIQLRDKIGR